MTDAQLVVVGAGPAGLAAAIQARDLGVDVLVLDENARPGGQIYRQLPPEFSVGQPGRLGSTFARGAALLAAAERAEVTVRSHSVVWSLDGELQLEVASPHGSDAIRARRVVLAAGAYDLPVPVRGWTLPGVFTVGGAQNLLKNQSLLVGKRILLAGTGPLLLLVASQLAKAGAEVVVADPVNRRTVLKHLPTLAAEWRLLLEGGRYHWSLLRGGARWLSPCVISSIGGDGRVQSATVATADDSWRAVAGTERTFEVDAVALGYGLQPSTELARLAGCRLEYDAGSATWLPVLDDDFTTTVPGLAIAGDGGGVVGAVAAVEQGRIAGVAAARDLGLVTPEHARELQRPSRARLLTLGRFRTAMDRIYAPRRGLHDLATPETVLCRCEEVTAAEVDEAIAMGTTGIGPLKAATRVTMGPCQGRMCLPALIARVARETGVDPSAVDLARPRSPSKPLPLACMVGTPSPGGA